MSFLFDNEKVASNLGWSPVVGSWGRSERIWVKVRTTGTDMKLGRMGEEGVGELLQGA